MTSRFRHAPPVLSGLLVAAAAACGQGPGNGPGPGESMAVTISPTSGTPGARVDLEARGFPADTPVDVGVGPPESEYEVIERTRTDADGRLSTTVPLPGWTEPGRSYVFVVSTWSEGPGATRAVSEPFIVTAPDAGGSVRITGRLTDEGVECPALRSDDETLYTLAGETDPFAPGDRVTVFGAPVEVSVCMQGTTLRIDSVVAAADTVAGREGTPRP